MNIDYSPPYYSKGNRFYQNTLYQVLKEEYEGNKYTGYGNVLFTNKDLIKHPFNLIYGI